jgi:TPR repeat protein
MPILFLSHSGADTEAARALKKRIEGTPAAKEAGLKVWFDKDDLRAGESWQKQLAETIQREATAFAVLLGARGIVNWVEAEVEVALSRATTSAFPFIPIIAKESAGSNALPAFARRYQGVLDPLNDSDQLAKLIKAATGDWDREPNLTDEPFVGLRAMDESWANRFFGRKAEVHALVEKFKKRRLVAIVADSGAGKSSLAQAGLIPAFRGGALADDSREEPDDKIWHVVIMRPGNDPIQGLKDGITDAARLLGLDGSEQAKLRGRINISDPGESAYALRCDLDHKKTETLLIIDQFEELLIQTPEDKRAPFTDFLCALADGPFGFRILLTLRADYFNLDDSLATLRARLWAHGQDAVFRLKRMSPEALAETAREPLALVGFKDQAAVEALIQAIQRDVSDREGDLALVQMALHSVWRRHKIQSEDLLQAYAEVQGVSGALAYEAEKVREKLNDAQKALLFPILARLIRRGELGGATRRMAQRDEFDAEKQRLIAHLSSEEGRRLLLAGGASVEIAHEALITRWPWLRTEGQKYVSEIDELARLMEKAKAWAKVPVDERRKYLATGAELETFSALAKRRKDWLSNKECEFVDASKMAHEAEEKRKADDAAKLKRQVFLLSLFAIGLLIAVVGVDIQRHDAEKQRQAAEEQRQEADQILAGATHIIVKLQHQLDFDAQTQVFRLFQTGAAHRDTTSMSNLGIVYANGYGVALDYAKAREWYEKAADKGEAVAMTGLGELYANGQGVAQDYAKAREWYEQAADRGQAPAMTNLGLLYENGQGVAQDYVKAREWYENAADKGEAIAMTNLGLLYADGHGVAQNYAKAREWYEKAADKGEASAMNNLGTLYENGMGVAQDYAKAREWYEKAADKGDAVAMNNLGALYADGHGVAQDYAKAREWYEKAADKGEASAMTNLGLLYADGHGVAQDYAKAREWYEKAADKGKASAMTNLGLLYADGHGVAQDYAKAREWYEKAADKGDAFAMARLEKLPISEAAEAGRYAEALHLQEALAEKEEAVETKREGKPGKETAQALGSLAWRALFAREFAKALTAADRAHALLPDNLPIEINRAHALMFLGRGNEAQVLYLAHKGKPVSEEDSKPWERVIADDFAEFRKAGLKHPMMANIEKKLGVSR